MTHKALIADSLQQRCEYQARKIAELEADLVELGKSGCDRDMLAPMPHAYPMSHRAGGPRSLSISMGERLFEKQVQSHRERELGIRASSYSISCKAPRDSLHHEQGLRLVASQYQQINKESDTHLNARCKTQARLIEEIIKEKELIFKQLEELREK